MTKKDVCAIVISYADLTACKLTISALYNQVSHIVIVDNFSTISLSNELSDIYGCDGRITLMSLDQNYGIAYALNHGVKLALSMKYDWILTMDQDSIASPNMIDGMFECVESLSDNNGHSNVCVFASYRLVKLQNKLCKEIYMGITSGNLLSSSIFNDYGFYNEGYFIDSVDFEFFLRIKYNGVKFYRATNAYMTHSLGKKNNDDLNFLQNEYTHSPLRRYYIFRNHLYLCKAYITKNPLYLTWKTINLIKLYIVIVLFEKNKVDNLKMIHKGLLDFMTGKMGRF